MCAFQTGFNDQAGHFTSRFVFAVVDLCDDEKTINQEAWLGASSHEILLFIEVNILLKKRLNLIFTF
jgi:hypothetical protein